MDGRPDPFRPPSLAFATLSSFLDLLASRARPPQIDRSMMSSRSGTDQNALMSTLSGFGLIGEKNEVLPALESLVGGDTEQRKAELAKLVRQYYPEAVRISEDNGTQQQLQDVFTDDYGISTPDTRRKAMTFFLHAAREADLHISENFKKTRTSGSGSPGSPRSKRTRTARKPTVAPPADDSPAPSANTSLTYSTEVTIGDTVLILTAKNPNPFAIPKADREFIFSLSDSMKEYEQKQNQVATSSPASSGAASNTDSEVSAS